MFQNCLKIERFRAQIYANQPRPSPQEPVDETSEKPKPIKKQKKAKFSKSFKHFDMKLALQYGW